MTKDSADKSVLEAFITRYKDTFYAELARGRLREIERGKTAALPPARPSSGGEFPFHGRWEMTRMGAQCATPTATLTILIAKGEVAGGLRCHARWRLSVSLYLSEEWASHALSR